MESNFYYNFRFLFIQQIISMSLNKKILFTYKGIINYSVKQTLCMKVLDQNEIKDKKINERKGIRYLLDECLTNIHNYYKANNLERENFVLRVQETKGNLLFEFKNKIIDDDIGALSDKITLIGKCKEKELKRLLLKTLKNKQEKDKMGAGLGLITIKQKLNCDITAKFLKSGKKMKILKLVAMVFT